MFSTSTVKFQLENMPFSVLQSRWEKKDHMNTIAAKELRRYGIAAIEKLIRLNNLLLPALAALIK